MQDHLKSAFLRLNKQESCHCKSSLREVACVAAPLYLVMLTSLPTEIQYPCQDKTKTSVSPVTPVTLKFQIISVSLGPEREGKLHSQNIWLIKNHTFVALSQRCSSALIYRQWVDKIWIHEGGVYSQMLVYASLHLKVEWVCFSTLKHKTNTSDAQKKPVFFLLLLL